MLDGIMDFSVYYNSTRRWIMRCSINRLTKKKKLEYGFVAVMTVFHIINFFIFYVYVNVDALTMGFRDELTNQFTWRYFEIFKMDIFSPMSPLKESLTNTLLTFFVQNIIAKKNF